MKVITRDIYIETRGDCDIIDITPDVAAALEKSEIDSGTVTVFITGSTAGVTTVEYEPGLVQDLKNVFDRLIPQDMNYNHDMRWHDGNGHAHVRASLLGSSLVIPFNNRKMELGTWQQIIVIDFDNRPRKRDIMLQIMGE